MLLNILIQLIIFYSILYLSNSQNQFYRVQPHDISALIGSNITIPCAITPPHGDIQWTKDGLALGYDRELSAFPSWSIIGDENNGEFNFFIRSLKLDDEGIFACEVSPYKDASALKQIANVRTLVRPKYVQINDQFLFNTTIIKIRFDEIIHQIDCQVNGAKPAAHIKWINETGQEFPATSRIFIQDRLFSTISTLTLVPSLSLNEKHFTCDVRHETFTDNTHILRRSFVIQITSPPDIPLIRSYSFTNRLMNGSYLTLSCRSYGGYPLGRLSWYRLDNEKFHLIDNSSIIIPEKNFIENNISMIIASSDNNLTFSCHAMNDYLESSGQILQKNITLHVAFGPLSVHIRDNDMKETTLIEGIPRRFQCRTSSSNPRAIVTWKLDEDILSSDIDPIEEAGEYGGRIIQITKTIGLDKSLRIYHKKILSCEAKNLETGRIIIDSTQLNIIFDAINIEMHGITKDKIIKSGNRIIAECNLIGGNPLGKIIWYKGNELLHSESHIDTNGEYVLSRVEFIALASDNNLPLTCKGQVENFPQKFASFILNIIFLPEEIRIIDHTLLSNLSIDNDNSRVFECRTSISNPQAQLIITRQSNDGEKHLDIQYKTSSSYINGINSIQFMLPPIDLSFHGNLLICDAILDIDIHPLIKRVTYVLYVNHKPYFQNFNSSFEVKENQSFNITFKANAYPFPISYTWFHPSGRQLMNDQLNIFVNQSQLTLINIQRNDRGVYRCLATNSIGNTEVNFTLNVLYGPIIIRTQGYSVSEALIPGSLAILSCVVDANPIDLNNVRWYKDQQEILIDQWENRIEGKEISLIRKSVQREDAGQYTCEIDNQFGNNRATLPLFIQYAPEIDRNAPNRTKVAIDSDRLLTAEFHCYLSAIPKPTVIWLKNNQILPISSKYQSIINERISSSSNLLFDAILSVSNITKADYGTYQCKAENTLGIDTTEIILTGLTNPDPPSQVHVLNTSHSSVLISWLPGFDGGGQQKFQIRYRLSTADRYSYEDVPFDMQSFDLKNLRLGSEYHVNIRSNNSYYLSQWTNEIIVTTLNTFPSLSFHLSAFTSRKLSFNIILILFLFGLIILLINIILIVFFFIKRRISNVNNENLSTTGTNETETNTIDLFQPIPSNFCLINTYKKYEDDDIKRPFVSSFSSINLSQQDNISSQAMEKKDRSSPYDNVRTHQYHPTNFDNHPITYRSFKADVNNPINTDEYFQAELV